MDVKLGLSHGGRNTGLRVLENMVLERHLGLRGTGWRNRHNDLYSSPNTIQMLKSCKMRWAGHVAGMGREVCTGSWWGDT